jgi:hypothetical protein
VYKRSHKKINSVCENDWQKRCAEANFETTILTSSVEAMCFMIRVPAAKLITF